MKINLQLFIRHKENHAAILGAALEGDYHVDIQAPLKATDRVGGKPVSEWTDGLHNITISDAREFVEPKGLQSILDEMADGAPSGRRRRHKKEK